MDSFDLSKMTVEDLFRAKKERRKQLASLSFEQKIEIVRRLQSVSRKARAEVTKDRAQRPGTKFTR